jgi:EAL domain-containing protein (putative c-di-GMP-specific phosphodiesterase class I)
MLDPGPQKPVSLETVKRLRAAIGARDIRISAKTLSPAVNAAVTSFPGLDLSAEETQIEADLTTGRARDAGDSNYAEVGPAYPRPLEGRVKLGDRIQEALDDDLLRLLGEPTVCLQTGSIVQWQVLAQLVHTEGWLLPPASFVAAAERFGLAERLDTFVSSRAIERLEQHPAADPKLRLDVSISGKSLSSPAFLEWQEGAIASSGISPESLIFSIPASAPSAAAARFSERLASLGCQFALNHFGTGPTPLGGLASLLENATQLADLSIACLKIDERLVRHLIAEASHQPLVKDIARLAAGLGIKSLATNVSNEATAEMLRDCGVDYGLGRHLGMPLPLCELQ